jgi:hypothetical protein
VRVLDLAEFLANMIDFAVDAWLQWFRRASASGPSSDV